MGADYMPFERQLHDATEGRALALCGAEPFAAATQHGAALTLDDALGSHSAGSESAVTTGLQR